MEFQYSVPSCGLVAKLAKASGTDILAGILEVQGDFAEAHHTLAARVTGRLTLQHWQKHLQIGNLEMCIRKKVVILYCLDGETVVGYVSLLNRVDPGTRASALFCWRLRGPTC